MKSHRRSRWLAQLTLSVACAMLVVSPAIAEDNGLSLSGKPPLPIADDYFGLHIHHLSVPYSDGTSSWPFIPFGSWRLWSSYVDWAKLEPKKGKWDFRHLDYYVAQGVAHGTDILLTLGRTPSWASSRPHEHCGGCAAEPASIDDWKNYVRTVVKRYKGRIAFYEIWNEPRFYELEGPSPDGKVGFYSGSVAKLVELAKAAREVISQEDPQAKIVSPSFVSDDLGIRRLEFFLKAGGGKYFDILGFHFYTDVPEKIPGMYRKLAKLKAKYQLHSAPIWNTEFGFNFERPDLSILPKPRKGSFEDILPVRLGAAYVSRSLILAAASGVRRFYWFNWDGEPPHEPMGIAKSRGTAPTPMTSAYTMTRNWLLGKAVEPCESRQGTVWICRIREADGRTAWAVWTQEKDALADLSDVVQGGQVEYLLGDPPDLIADPTRILVGPEPRLLRP